ncbi:MAG TPA: serine hydrolase domain-containing protein [Acidimicrobiales bacterium]|jgi:CubicO group peptidase (beta-lactamase class C family)|nr:serine hydrolase domain-containing protein [Acidimicrobiales bacterium]
MGTLDEVVAGAVGGHRAPGAVAAVSRDGEVEVGAAHADPEALYQVGSVTKVMTATLVLQHVERGDIALDDPVADHLDDFRLDPPEATRQVTVRHLLTHTCGIDRADAFVDTGSDDGCLARFVAEVIAGAPLIHAPGEHWSYCNAGYVVLGRLVEVLDGRPWDDALAARIFDPLGLAAVTAARLDRTDSPLAAGHRYDPERGEVVPEPQVMPRSVGPAGNVVATAADLVRFAEALTDGRGRLLGPDLAAAMLEPDVPMRIGHQGLGWTVPLPGVGSHGGTTPGGTALLVAMPGRGAFAVVADGPGALAISAAVRAHLFGAPAQPLGSRREPGTGPELAPEACAGRYARYLVTRDVTCDASGTLTVTTTYQEPLAGLFREPEPTPLEPLGGGSWAGQHPYEDFPQLWDFSEPDGEGRPRLLSTGRLSVRVG